MELSIGLLGPLVIESQESLLGKIPKKAQGIVGLSGGSARRQTVSRERLADAAMAVSGLEQARHSLRNCLLELRKHSGRKRRNIWSAISPIAVCAGCGRSRPLRVVARGRRGPRLQPPRLSRRILGRFPIDSNLSGMAGGRATARWPWSATFCSG